MAIEKRYERTESMFTDKVEAQGTVRRVYFFALYVFGNYDTTTGNRLEGNIYEWHYFGTTPAQRPPYSHPEAVRVQNTYISFPVDFEALPAEWANQYYYQMAQMAGRWKEGYKEGLE